MNNVTPGDSSGMERGEGRATPLAGFGRNDKISPGVFLTARGVAFLVRGIFHSTFSFSFLATKNGFTCRLPVSLLKE